MKRLIRIKYWRKKDLPLDKMQLQQGEGSESFQWMISVHVISDFVIFLQAMYTNNHFKEGKKEKRKKKRVPTHDKKQLAASFVHQPSCDPSSKNLQKWRPILSNSNKNLFCNVWISTWRSTQLYVLGQILPE